MLCRSIYTTVRTDDANWWGQKSKDQSPLGWGSTDCLVRETFQIIAPEVIQTVSTCLKCYGSCTYVCCCSFSVIKSCLTLLDPMGCSTPGFSVLHHLPEFAQIHVHWVGDAIQPSHPLPFPSPRVFSLSQHQAFFQWVSSSHHVAKVLELQLQYQSFQWIFRIDFL